MFQAIKTKKGRATAKTINEAAMYLFKTKGYENTTIVEICKTAGVGYGTLYHYFKTKQDIMVNFVLEETKELENYYNNIEKKSYTEVIERICKFQISCYLIKGQSFVAAWYSAYLLQKKEFFDKDNYSLTRILKQCFCKGQETGEIRTDIDAEFMGEMVEHLIYGVTTDWCYYDGNIDLHEKFRNQFLMLMKCFAIK